MSAECRLGFDFWITGFNSGVGWSGISKSLFQRKAGPVSHDVVAISLADRPRDT